MAYISRVCQTSRTPTVLTKAFEISRRSASSGSRLVRVSEEVQQALASKQPVVALESTIYTHGFPYPDNLSLASRLESLVRLNGGVPATIGVLDGIPRVGLGADELVRLVSSAGSSSTRKVSRRDLGFACGLRDANGNPFNGGTTVSATMILAHIAGIKIFATGGLGGVHRGVAETMDVSADLTELGRTPVAVIGSGCKSFLDIPKTLEFLETQGVAVATFADGRSGSVDFPAFYSRESGIKSPMVLKDEFDAAGVIHAHLSLGLSSGLFFGNPIAEQHSIPRQEMEASIEAALKEASSAGVTGAASTPFILAKIKDLVGEKSIKTNRALVEGNVVRGTKVARLLLQIEACESHENDHNPGSVIVGPGASNYTVRGVSRGVHMPEAVGASSKKAASSPSAKKDESPPKVFVAGSLALDLACDFTPRTASPGNDTAGSPALYTSNPARITQSLGGVGANVARAAHLMGASVRLCSAVGDDLAGNTAIKALNDIGLSTAGVKISGSASGGRTAQYIAVNDGKKDLYLAVADMSILESNSTDVNDISASFDTFWLPQMASLKPSHLVIDGNWPSFHLSRWLEAGSSSGAHVTFEPVSNAKSVNIFKLPERQRLSAFPNSKIHLATPNMYELASMYQAAQEIGALSRRDWWEVVDAFGIPQSGARTQLALATSNQLVDQGIPQQTLQLLPFIPCICTKLGSQGVLLTQIIPAGDNRLTDGEYAPYILSKCSNDTEETLGVGGVYMRRFPAAEEVKAEEIMSVNGVGDTFVGALVAGLAQSGRDARVEDLVDRAQKAAVLTLKNRESVSPDLRTLSAIL